MNAPTRRDRRPRVIGYARLSRNPDGSLVSVKVQKATMQRYADANGLELVECFADDNLSAWKTTVKRRGWEAFLVALASTPDLDGALSYHFDRLARNGRDGERFLDVMEAHSLALYTPQQVMNLGADADARMIFRIMVAVAINQSDSTSRRVRLHKDEARRDGNMRRVYGGPPTLGLRNGEHDWETEPLAAACLRDVAARVLADPEHNFAAAFAAQPPIFDATGRRASEAMARDALKRPATAGLIAGRDGEPLSYEAVIADPPLDPATWRRLRAMFDGRKGRARPADADRYPLGALLRCERCGNQLTGTPIYDRRDSEDGARVVVKTTLSYACRNPHKRIGVTKPCHGCSIAAEDVHAVIHAAVEAWAEAHPDYLAAAAAQPATGSREAELAASLDRAQADLADLFDNRRYISRARYDASAADLRGEIDRITAELDTLAQVAANPLPASIEWDEMTAAETRALAELALVTPIKVAPGKRALTALDRMSVEPRP